MHLLWVHRITGTTGGAIHGFIAVLLKIRRRKTEMIYFWEALQRCGDSVGGARRGLRPVVSHFRWTLVTLRRASSSRHFAVLTALPHDEMSGLHSRMCRDTADEGVQLARAEGHAGRSRFDAAANRLLPVCPSRGENRLDIFDILRGW